MLSRIAGITKEGDLDIRADPRMLYQVMVMTRLALTFGGAVNIMLACMVATRYAICRRQFANIKGSTQERKLIDYQTHMAVLGPNLANGYVLAFAANEIDELL